MHISGHEYNSDIPCLCNHCKVGKKQGGIHKLHNCLNTYQFRKNISLQHSRLLSAHFLQCIRLKTVHVSQVCFTLNTLSTAIYAMLLGLAGFGSWRTRGVYLCAGCFSIRAGGTRQTSTVLLIWLAATNLRLERQTHRVLRNGPNLRFTTKYSQIVSCIS